MCYFLTHYSRLILATGWIELYTCPVETTRPEQSNVRCGKRCKWYTDGRPAGNLMLKWCELMSVWWLLTPVSNQIELLGLQRLLSLHTRHLLQPSVTHLLTHWVRHHCMLAPSQQLLQISVWILWTATLNSEVTILPCLQVFHRRFSFYLFCSSFGADPHWRMSVRAALSQKQLLTEMYLKLQFLNKKSFYLYSSSSQVLYRIRYRPSCVK